MHDNKHDADIFRTSIVVELRSVKTELLLYNLKVSFLTIEVLLQKLKPQMLKKKITKLHGSKVKNFK